MPAGLDVTVPLPMPVLATFSVKRLSVKVAVTVREFVIETVQVVPETTSQPVQPPKIESASGAAVSVTGESLRNDAEQVDPQLMPPGADVTVPPPSPCFTAASVNICLTVSTVLPAFPNASVAVIVAVPRPIAVTSPVELTVAMLGSLLPHVRPVPCRF